MTGLGSGLRSDPEDVKDARAVARETMRRARANVELLIERLPTLGFVFEEATPFVPAPPGVADELDALEARIGLMPLSLRVWFEEVGMVSLNGRHEGWSFDYPDPLVVDAPTDFIASEHDVWQDELGTEWELRPVFEIGLAPDYLHKANVSGGPPYGVEVPNEGADGLLLWEPHQTTFCNYLRIAFRMGGMPGWQREPALLDDWALPSDPPPAELLELARRLRPL